MYGLLFKNTKNKDLTFTHKRDHDRRCSVSLLACVGSRCRAYIFPVVKNVPIDVSTHAQ